MEETQKLEGATKKYDPFTLNIGRKYYGESFERFMKIAEVKDLIGSFKDYYYSAKIKNNDARLADILQGFNKEICEPLGRKFHPYTMQVSSWRKKWDLDLVAQLKGKDVELIDGRNVHQVIKTRDAERNLVLGLASDQELEMGVRTLGGELLNDAMQMLRDDQQLEEIYDDETLIKRRSYVVNVFSHVTRLVHGKAALMLKASEEKRNTAGFLMNLLSRATAGTMSDEELALLKSAYAPQLNEEPQPK